MLKRHKVINLSYITFLFFLLFKLPLMSSSFNTTEARFMDKYNYAVLLPEGWGFFTRNPKDKKYLVYKINSDNQVTPTTIKNSSPESLFGFSRRSRRLLLETSKLISVIKSDSAWLLPRKNIRSIHEINFKTQHIHTAKFNQKQFHMLEPGVYIVKKYEISPWAWAKYPKNFTNDTSFTKIILR